MVEKQINFSEQQLKKLKVIIDETGLSESELIRRALDDYLERIVNK